MYIAVTAHHTSLHRISAPTNNHARSSCLSEFKNRLVSPTINYSVGYVETNAHRDISHDAASKAEVLEGAAMRTRGRVGRGGVG